MPNFHSPDLGSSPDSPFARDDTGKLVDIGRDHLTDQVCTQEILPPE